MRSKKKIALLSAAILSCSILISGCGNTNTNTDTDTDANTSTGAALEDGVYSADFDTDSSMFHVSEACWCWRLD